MNRYRPFIAVAAIVAIASSGCVIVRPQREIVRPAGCEQRLGRPEKRMQCMACVERPRPHAYFPDRPEGARCVPI